MQDFIAWSCNGNEQSCRKKK